MSCPLTIYNNSPAGRMHTTLWDITTYLGYGHSSLLGIPRRQGFRMITFDRQAGPLQNFNRSHVMAIGRSVSFSDPARPPGGGVGCPKHPKTPGTFLKKKISREKNSPFSPPPPQIFLFFCVLRPQENFLAEIFFSVKIPPPPPPLPTCKPPPSPQNTHPNPRAIINNPNNCSMTYRL